jgi:hypothetical protein
VIFEIVHVVDMVVVGPKAGLIATTSVKDILVK